VILLTMSETTMTGMNGPGSREELTTVNERRTQLLRYAAPVTGMVLLVAVILLGPHLYHWLYCALAYPPVRLSDAVRPHPHGVPAWGRWMSDVDARYRRLQGPGNAGLGGVVLVEAILAVALPVLVVWRGTWAVMTRPGRVHPEERGTHGSARFLDPRETAELRYRGGYLLLGDADLQMLGLDPRRQSENVLLVGPPGSGKSSGLIIPNLLREGGERSVVVTDLKGELYATCAPYLAQGGFEVWAVNFLDPAGSLGYNPLACCTDPLAAALFAEAWITNTGRSSDEPFWDNAAREVILAGIAHLQAMLPAPTLAHLQALLCFQTPAAVIAELERSPAPAARRTALGFLGAVKQNERLLGSVFAEIAPRFMVLVDKRVQATTARHEVELTRLIRPDERPVALFLTLDRVLQEQCRPLLASFFLDLFRSLSQAADAAPGGVLPRPVFVYGDEFGVLGAIPNMATWIATLRSAGVGQLLAVQTLAQVEALYGREAAATILAACGSKLALSGLSPQDARTFSDLAGTSTAVQHSASKQRGRFKVLADRGMRSQSEVARPLLTPDEVRRLGRDELLAVVGELQPLRLRQRRWYRDGPINRRVPAQPARATRAAVLMAPEAEEELRQARRDRAGKEHPWPDADGAAAARSGLASPSGTLPTPTVEIEH
jgi:type IV secretion system protein VirD4